MLFYNAYDLEYSQHIQSCILFIMDSMQIWIQKNMLFLFYLYHTVYTNIHKKKMPVFSFSTLRLLTNKQTFSS